MTLHEIKASPDGTSFRSIGPLDIFSQARPKENKSGELYSRVSAGDGFTNITIFLKGKVAMCRLPEPSKGITLTGMFTKNDWQGTLLNCENMDIPEGATVFEESDVVGKKPHISIIEAMNAGLKAADYVIKKDRPELASAAFEVAARALLDGISIK